MARTAIINGRVVTMDPARRILDGGTVLTDGATIEAVTPAGGVDLAGVDTVVDARGCAVLPGFVNSHTHLYHTFGRTLGPGQTFPVWLANQRRLVAQYTGDDFDACIELGLIENVRAGNTCVVDNMAIPAEKADTFYDIAADAAARVGLRYVLARGYTDQRVSPEYIEPAADIERQLRSLVARRHDTEGGRIRIMASPMLPWGVSAEMFGLTGKLARELGLGIHMHTAETADYPVLIGEAHGTRSHVEVYGRGDCLGPHVQLLGCNTLDAAEIDVIRSTGTAILLDPTCTAFKGRPIASYRALLTAGVPVGVGTNGAAAAGSQDMFECMKNVVGLTKLAEGASTFPSQLRALELATIEGARALRLDGQIGSLEPGKRADLIVVDLATPHAAPVLDVVAALVSSCRASDVRDVLVNGAMVVRDGVLQTASERHAIERAVVCATACAERAGVKVGATA